MLVDFAQKPNLGLYDLCIVGAGPAGITLALEMASVGWKIALLEGGGLEYSDRSQRLYAALGTQTLWAGSTRLRYFGGTSNHWSGRCRPFDSADFDRPPPGQVPGWPIRYMEIARYLPSAMQILDLPAEGFAALNEGFEDGQFAADSFALSAPTRFGSKYIGTLRQLPNVDLVINCNCVGLKFDAATRQISGVQAVDYSGGRADIRARRYVLAAGGIENPRILLASENLVARGVGGRMVGRCFMEHLNVELGEFICADSERIGSRQYYTSEEFVRSHRVGSGNVSFNLIDQIRSYGRTAPAKSFLKKLSCDLGLAEKVQFISTFTCPGTGLITTLLEQAPMVDGSRVTLSRTTDEIGMRKAQVDWGLSEEDRRSIRTIGIEVAKSFARSQLGLVKLRDYILDPRRVIPVSPHAHHMGSTRMAHSAEWGVVDADCRVFGTANLYIAGSSIFSTGGGCNPTMPIVQFALRLADHLKTRTA